MLAEHVDDGSHNESTGCDLLFKEFLRTDPEIFAEKVNILSNMFTDADLNFLKVLVKDSGGDEITLNTLIDERLLSRQYPKRKDFHKLKENWSLIKYRRDFNVEQFLTEYPEPFNFFENPFRTGTRKEAAINYLQKLYDTAVVDIEALYKDKKFNLSLTYKYLSHVPKKILPTYISSDDLSLIQEIAFLEHRDIIESTMQSTKSEIEEEDNDISFECMCCFDIGINCRDIVLCDNKHCFCKKCLIYGAQLTIAEGNACVKCFEDCPLEFDIEIVKKILPLFMVTMLERKKQEREIIMANLENLVSCPLCGFFIEIDPEITLIRCKNMECMQISCRNCRKENHLPLSCSENINEHSMRLYNEELLSKNLIRVCYNCKTSFIKSVGCNKITCVCGKLICYVCRRLIEGYEHFKVCQL